MAKKKRKKKHRPKIQPQQQRLAQIQEPVSKRKPNRSILVIAVLIAVVILIVFLYFKPTSFLGLFSNRAAKEKPGIDIPEKASLLPDIKHQFTDADIQFSDFVGSDSCMICHVEQYSLWRNSTHGRAGGEPGQVKIIARFDNQTLHFKDATVIPTVTDSGEYVFKFTQTGLPEKIIKVDAVVGGGHMEGGGTQSFFTRFPDGTLRFVPFDFNRNDDVWFVQLKDFSWAPISREVSIHNLANWPIYRILGTQDQFSNCQNCHGSQILVEYDSQNRTYQTRYTTLQINCESCHGPGKRHIELVRTADLDTLTDIGIVVLSTVGKDESINKCLECHAVKAAITNEFLSGKSFEMHYALKFPILATEPYLPDGRIRTFAYQQNHLFSDCYINGSMTCVDCHDPHALDYRDIFFQPLIGKFDDGQCVDCHPSKARAPEKHSFHKPDSPGNVCTACHMPFLQHPLLGNKVRFARSDHTIPIPRPEFDARLGIENACQQCHQDEPLSWQQQKTDEWYGTLKPHNPLIANNMAAKKVTDINEAAALLLNPDAQHPIAQVAGLFDFIKRFLKPNMPSLNPNIIDRLKRLTENSDLDVKALAFVALHLSADHRHDIHKFLSENIESLGPQEMAVRNRWAFAMDYVGTLFTLRRDYARAIRAHQKALEIKPLDAYTLVNLATAYQNSGNFADAIATLKIAIEVESTRASIYFQLAFIYSQSQQKQQAIKALKDGLKYDPENQYAKQMLRQLES